MLGKPLLLTEMAELPELPNWWKTWLYAKICTIEPVLLDFLNYVSNINLIFVLVHVGSRFNCSYISLKLKTAVTLIFL